MSSAPLNDDDSGDISLSSSHIPTTTSTGYHHSRSNSSVGTGLTSGSGLLPEQQSRRPHSRERDVSAPVNVSAKLFGKSLFTRSPQADLTTSSSRDDSASGGARAGLAALREEISSVSLNDDESIPTAKYPSQHQYQSQSSKSNSIPGASSATISNTKDELDGKSRPPSLGTRRISSNLGRSKSLNVKLPPSLSLHTDIKRSASPMTSTSTSTTSTPFYKNTNTNTNTNSVTNTPSSKLGWSRRPGEPRPPPLVNEGTCKKMNRWVKEVVVCNFDLERGPVVERRAGDRRWGQGEKENVAFSSFPDTSLFSEGSILFSFKIRHIPPDPSTLHHPEPPSPMPDRVVKAVEEEMKDVKIGDPPGEAEVLPGGGNGSGSGSGSGSVKQGDKAEEYRKWDERGREWLYGFVWFEQRRDKGITRGYMQKSLVILTHLPFPALFSAVLQKIAPVFFEHGYSALEAACHSIASWPDPTPDSILELPMMTDLLTVKLPDTTESPQIGKAFGVTSPTLQQPILAALPTSTPLRAFASFLPSLWSLWECLILAEPVLIIAPDPKTCSEIVWWLRDLLRPIPPAGDFRPYLHIHDHDFSLLVNSNKPQAGVIVGVTNPFFRNAASHWPNVISIPSQRIRRVVQNGTSPAITATSSPGLRDQPEGFLSRRHRSIQKDRILLKRLETLVAEGKLDDPEGNEALKTHFQQLTERFLVPLNRYFQTLVPTLSTPSPSVSPSTLPASTSTSTSTSISAASTSHTAGAIRPFSLPNFLSHLRNHGPNPLLFKTKGLSMKSRVENDFYASFCMSSTFARWLEARVDSLGLAIHIHNNNSTSGPNSTLHVPPNGIRTPTKNVNLTQSQMQAQSRMQTQNGNTRPGLPRSVSASVGLGILGNIIPDPSAQGRVSLNDRNTESESETPSELDMDVDSERNSVDSVGIMREQREREGSGMTIVPVSGPNGSWYDGRRASEGMVKFNANGSIGK
ncbi:uncharacterized protein IL334_007220 [Kwoniella shivajii]|uniref:UDENN domain-containing protein n=1 Tax=Kwoniella shivajii TaxID=564305 RepID=A0ABZ1D828_9TREE|nr:hypothetical protein IL334_007220 [Kwoniella shivajii]